jgi:hypothetical protein
VEVGLARISASSGRTLTDIARASPHYAEQPVQPAVSCATLVAPAIRPRFIFPRDRRRIHTGHADSACAGGDFSS